MEICTFSRSIYLKILLKLESESVEHLYYFEIIVFDFV